jgi:hypothetical protein
MFATLATHAPRNSRATLGATLGRRRQGAAGAASGGCAPAGRARREALQATIAATLP